MRIGVLELLVPGPVSGTAARIYAKTFTRQYVSIMPQAVSVWCRQLGHETHYATYYGQEDPATMLPAQLDRLFISSYTKNAPLAYALSKLARARGIVTVLGGPHAKAFPDDALRYFDFVVKDCDKQLVKDLLDGHFERRTVVTSGRPLRELPSVEERMPEIATASFDGGRPGFMSVIPLLASVGCPYSCDFCIDWNVDYATLPPQRLVADLQFISARYPGVMIGFHDPNFGVRFDETMDQLASIPAARRNGYVMESSLSILKESRLRRLRETNCVFVLPGIESWADYSNKAGVGTRSGHAKFQEVTAHIEKLSAAVDGIQANFIFGTDGDAGTEPVELTKAFITRFPDVWPAINVPIPYGGTPLTERLLSQGRVNLSMPLMFYRNPYAIFQPANYDLHDYYAHWLDMRGLVMSTRMLLRRAAAARRPVVRFMNVIRTLTMRSGYREAAAILEQLASDAQFRAFHEGRSDVIPGFYHARYEATLGKYASLIPEQERSPLLSQAPASTGAAIRVPLPGKPAKRETRESRPA